MVIRHLCIERVSTCRECNRHLQKVSCRFLYRSVCVVTVSGEVLDIAPEVIPPVDLKSCHLDFLDSLCRSAGNLKVLSIILAVCKRITDTPLVEEGNILRLHIKSKSHILITAGNCCQSQVHLDITCCLLDDRLGLCTCHPEGERRITGLAGRVCINREHNHVTVLS